MCASYSLTKVATELFHVLGLLRADILAECWLHWSLWLISDTLARSLINGNFARIFLSSCESELTGLLLSFGGGSPRSECAILLKLFDSIGVPESVKGVLAAHGGW